LLANGVCQGLRCWASTQSSLEIRRAHNAYGVIRRLTLVTGPLGVEPGAGHAFPRTDRGRVDEKGEAADNRERLFALRYWKPRRRSGLRPRLVHRPRRMPRWHEWPPLPPGEGWGEGALEPSTQSFPEIRRAHNAYGVIRRLTLATGPLGVEPGAGHAFPRIDRGRVDEKGEAADNRERLFALRYWKPESRAESAPTVTGRHGRSRSSPGSPGSFAARPPWRALQRKARHYKGSGIKAAGPRAGRLHRIVTMRV